MGLGAAGGVNSIYNAAVNPSAGGIIGGLSGANTAANDISRLTGNGSLNDPGISTALGDAGSGLGIYSAFANPTASNIIGGLAGGVNLARTGSNLASGAALGDPATGALGTAGTALGAAGAGLGLYGALQNPSNPVNDIQGALDAYKLYNAGSTLAGTLGGAGAGTGAGGAAGTAISADAANTANAALASAGGSETGAGLGAALGGIGTGVGALAAAYMLGNYLTGRDAQTPLEAARNYSTLASQEQDMQSTNPAYAADMANEQTYGGVAPFTPFTGTTDAQATAWLQAMMGSTGGAGTGTTRANQQTYRSGGLYRSVAHG